MAIQPPKITTYHCICSSLLLASTHTLSSLPRCSTETGALDASIILPLPPTPPTFEDADHEESASQDMPTEGYMMTLGMNKDSKATIVRREDGFEKRVLWRCGRCRVVVGYELMGQDRMDVDGGKGKGKRYEGRVMYVLPGGMMSTDFMAGDGKRPGGGDVDIKPGFLAAFE